MYSFFFISLKNNIKHEVKYYLNKKCLKYFDMHYRKTWVKNLKEEWQDIAYDIELYLKTGRTKNRMNF